MRASLVWGCAALLSACGADRAFVALPELPDTIESWVVARLGQDGEVRVDAADRGAPAIEIAVSEGAVELELRGFASSLAALELARGPVPRAMARKPSAPLPPGAITMRAHLDGVVAAPWEMGALDDVARFLRPISTACGTITTSIATLPTTGDVDWVQPIDGDTLLLGTSTYDVILLDVGERPRTIAVQAPTPARLTAVFADASRTLWFGDEDGGLWRGRLGRDALMLERAVEPTGLGPVRGVDGDPSSPGAQLFVITRLGAVARVLGSLYTEIDRFEVGFDTGTYTFGLVWLGPNDILHAHSSSHIVHRWQAGVTSSEALNTGDAGIIALEKFPNGRVVASMGSGLIAVFDRTTAWTRLERGPFSLDIRATYPFGGGFLYGGAYGYLGQWDEKEGFCPIQQSPLAAHTIDFIRPLGDRMAVLGESRPVFPKTPFLTVRVE